MWRIINEAAFVVFCIGFLSLLMAFLVSIFILVCLLF